MLFLIKILSLDSVDFRFFYVVCLLLFMTQQHPIVCLCDSVYLLAHWWTLDCFHFWAITSKTVKNFHVQNLRVDNECSNYCTIAHISHASKIMLKILQVRLQQYVNQELSNHLTPCHPLLLLPLIFPSIRVFSNLQIRWPKYWSFSFSISPSNEYLGLISFRID